MKGKVINMKIPEIAAKKKAAGKPIFSFEIFPPKKQEALENIDATLEKLCALHPDFISVTFGAGGSAVNNQTVEIAKKIKNIYGVEPAVHLTCLHYSKEEISAILKELEAAGIENILALRGDVNPDIPMKHDFRYANELVSFIKSQGDFHVSGACYPEKHEEAPNPEFDLSILKQKQDLGAKYAVTQLFYDNRKFFDFVDRARKAGVTIPIIPGIKPLAKKSQLTVVAKTFHVDIPKELADEAAKLKTDEEVARLGVEWGISQCKELFECGVPRIHFYTVSAVNSIKEILKEL